MSCLLGVFLSLVELVLRSLLPVCPSGVWNEDWPEVHGYTRLAFTFSFLS